MFKKDDIVVRIISNSYIIGSIGKCLRDSTHKDVEVQWDKDGRSTPDNINIRLATPLEIIAFNSGITNINDIKEKYYEIY